MMVRSWHFPMVVAAVAVGALGGIPELPFQDPQASVSGVVYDSLVDAPLVDADVQLLREGSPTRVYDARTDSLGRFSVANVEAGTYVAGFFHPRLDSLGIDLPPHRFTLEPSVHTELSLATPSRLTILSAVCPDSTRNDETTLLLGVVRRASSGEPLPGAVVSVQWSALAFQDTGGTVGLATVRRGGVVPATPDGRFAVCNLPVDAEFTVRAATGADTSGALALSFPPVGILARDIFVAPLVSDEASAGARLSGRVTAATGQPVVGARVSLWGFESVVRTGAEGEFAFTEVPGGSTTLDVRGIGFEPVRQPIDLRTGTGRDNSVSIVVARAPTTLAPVTVVDRSSRVLVRSGFEQRRTSGVGRFLDEAALAKGPQTSMTAVLSQFPGMITQSGGRGNRLFMRDPTGRVCSPTIFIDGAPYAPAAEADIEGAVDIDLLADPSRIAGIEIYRRAAQAPLQYGGTTRSACGVVVIWRKEQ